MGQESEQVLRKTFADYPEESLVAVVDSIKHLEKLFKQEFDLDIYLTWGTLLGAVREGDFIKFDNDVDIAYLTKQTTDFEIIEEHEFIVRILLESGYPVQRNSKGQIHVRVQPEDSSIKGAIYNLDLWTTWVREDKFYHYPDIKGEVKANEVAPLKKIQFRGEQFWIPASPDKLLIQFYGENWQQPDPDYAWYPKYDVDDEFEFLRIRPSNAQIPEYPQKVSGLSMREEDNHFYLSSKVVKEQRLNASAMLVLELCNSKNTIKDIINIVQQSYALSSAPEVVVLEFLGNAVKTGLINFD